MKMTPHMQGNYSWYSFTKGDAIVPREPWHQYVDIFTQFEKFKESGHLSEKLGVIQYAGEIDVFTELLEPKHRLNLDGQVLHFPKLWDLGMEKVEEGEINFTLSPLEEDLYLLAGYWMKKKPEPVWESGVNYKEKIKEFKTKLAGNEEAFEVLNTHFGDIKTVLPRLRVKLDKLQARPRKRRLKTVTFKQS
jgi:hypothetical protein